MDTRVEEKSGWHWHGLASGTVIGGKYRIERELARGGMGIVYLAKQAELHRTVAIKVIAPSLASEPDFVRRFRREALALAQLRHANVVAVYDFGEDSDLLFLVMEYVEGSDLENFVSRYGASGVDPELALGLLEQLLCGLAHAHGRGVLHRDIKPANLLVGQDSELRITDFGLAQIRADIAAEPGKLATEVRKQGMTQVTAGTYEFMAPEVRRGEQSDQRADIYSVGVIVYWLLTGKLPGPLAPPLSRQNSGRSFHPGWDKLISQALAEDPRRRFASAQDMLAELRSLKGSKAPRVRRGDLPQRTEDRSQDSKLLTKAMIAGVVVVLVTGLVGVGWILTR